MTRGTKPGRPTGLISKDQAMPGAMKMFRITDQEGGKREYEVGKPSHGASICGEENEGRE